MPPKPTTVQDYLLEGCGRCKYGGTPECKVHSWPNELEAMRALVLECGLTEEVKWSQPCYTIQGKNVLIVSAFKHYSSLSFFKGSLLSDEKKILVAPGDHSHAARQYRCAEVEQLERDRDELKALIFEAIELERAGAKVDFGQASKTPDMPDELIDRMKSDAAFKEAFESLTPGRQRGYILHFAQAKQSETRRNRIEKWAPAILMGKGMQDR